jgi:hypothetical protein
VSIVIGTRLPQGPQPASNEAPASGGRKTTAYLVSLEGLEPLLPTAEVGGAPGPPPTSGVVGAAPSGGASLRLAVLTTWTFYTTGDSAGFVDTLLSLNGRDQKSETDADTTTLQLDYQGSNATVAAALAMGYVPLDETLRDAGRTVSWYRGPLIPYQSAAPALDLPISSSDQALVFDPTTGMFDTSYAAAWSLGRQLALQDSTFAAALYRWKVDATAKAVAAAEAELLAEAFGPLFGAPVPEPDGAAAAMTASRSLRRQTLLALPRSPRRPDG